MFNFEIYVGATALRHEGRVGQEATMNPGNSYGMVSRLTQGLEGRWHCIAMDNFFSIPQLFEDMNKRGFYCIRTVRPNRRGFPSSWNYGNNQPRGTLHVMVYRDKNMAAVHWMDCKGVLLLTTKYDPVALGLYVDRHVGLNIIQVRTSPMQVLYTSKM
jgi:hypothetical protein